jgi:hypothetical protein
LRSQGKPEVPSEALAEITQAIETQLLQREREIQILESQSADSQRRFENRESLNRSSIEVSLRSWSN